MPALDGLHILVPESRELDLFASMLEAEGATTLRCPLVQILDLEDRSEADRWIDEFIADPFDDLVLMTGEGLRRLLALSGARRDGFIATLSRTRTLTRGPKPARALREIGLAPGLAAKQPTSQGVLDTLAKDHLEGRRIGVQIYPGAGTQPLIAALRARGAEAFPVTPYRYASEAENEQVADIIRRLASASIGMVVFTASLQIDRLFEVARSAGSESELLKGLASTPIAAIGPVVEDALGKLGLTAAVRPETSFHLKPLVRAIAAWRNP